MVIGNQVREHLTTSVAMEMGGTVKGSVCEEIIGFWTEVCV